MQSIYVIKTDFPNLMKYLLLFGNKLDRRYSPEANYKNEYHIELIVDFGICFRQPRYVMRDMNAFGFVTNEVSHCLLQKKCAVANWQKCDVPAQCALRIYILLSAITVWVQLDCDSHSIHARNPKRCETKKCKDTFTWNIFAPRTNTRWLHTTYQESAQRSKITALFWWMKAVCASPHILCLSCVHSWYVDTGSVLNRLIWIVVVVAIMVKTCLMVIVLVSCCVRYLLAISSWSKRRSSRLNFICVPFAYYFLNNKKTDDSFYNWISTGASAH